MQEKKKIKTKTEAEKEKYVNKEVHKQNWKENLIKDGQFLKNSYFGNITNFNFFFLLNICKHPGM